MYLKEINYLLKIQQYRSITRASEELFITQPALSKFLKNIETQVGAPLFSRIGNELIPTHVGKRYLAYASKIAALQDDWNVECGDLLNEEKGHLSMMIPPQRSSCIIPEVMPAFYQKYPQVQVHLTEETNLIEKHWLASREIDFVIYSDVQPRTTLLYRELGKEEIVLIMALDHPLRNCQKESRDSAYPSIDLKLLADEPFILNQTDQTTGKISNQLFERAGVVPRVIMHTRNTETAIRLAAAGIGLAFAPESYVRNLRFNQPPLCFSAGEEKAEVTLYALFQSGRYLPSYSIYFLNLVEEYMASFHRASDC